MKKVYNFSAGPGMLPEDVLKIAQSEFLNYKNSGMSVMEMSHRSSIYQSIFDETENSFRKVLNIPNNYEVLFLQGGASLQFSMVPLNLLKQKAGYINSGSFASKAIEEAKRYGNVDVLCTSEHDNFSYIPDFSSCDFSPYDYIHITENNTIYGTKFNAVPDTKNVPLVSDASSCILSEQIDINKYKLIYAGAQKNIGPAGVTIVIIHKDLIGNPLSITPSMLNYAHHAKNGSMYNTPTTYSIYIAGLVFKYLLDIGGVSVMENRNIKKATMLYQCIDNSSLYKGVARKDSRSKMNVTFTLPTEELTTKFVKEAAERGLVNLKGHRDTGGIRASIYNAMPLEGVERLISFMDSFEKNN